MTDFSFEEFAKMFDAALASDNPAVKAALRNFMIIAAMVHPCKDNATTGPLEGLIIKVDLLERRVKDLQHASNSKSSVYTYPAASPYPYPAYNSNTYTLGGGITGAPPSSYTTTSTIDSINEITAVLKNIKTV